MAKQVLDKTEMNKILEKLNEDMRLVDFYKLKDLKTQEDIDSYLMRIDPNYRQREAAERYKREKKAAFRFLMKVLGGLIVLAVLAHLVQSMG